MLTEGRAVGSAVSVRVCVCVERFRGQLEASRRSSPVELPVVTGFDL